MLQLLKYLFGYSKKESSVAGEINVGVTNRLSRACIRQAIDHERSPSVTCSYSPPDHGPRVESVDLSKIEKLATIPERGTL